MRKLNLFLSVVFVLCLSTPAAQAATWQDYKAAGFRAYEIGNYAEAEEQFQAALSIAYQGLGTTLENLAATYLAAGQPERAGEVLEQWDRILLGAGDEPWAAEHRKVRDDLAAVILEILVQSEPLQDLKPTAATTDAQPAAGDFAIHLISAEPDKNVQSAWDELKANYPTQLAEKSLVVKQVDLGGQGTFNRILAAPFSDSADAQETCRKLKDLGQYCTVQSLE